MDPLAAAKAQLLDYSQPLNVELLDRVTITFYTAADPGERKAAEDVLRAFQEHSEAWTRVDAILEKAKDDNTKFYALQILQQAVQFRWGALPAEQRLGIRNYVSNLIISLCQDERTFRAQHVFLNKVNIILVQIVKHEWPAKWPGFISEIVNASRVSPSLCENTMVVLRLLSEEVFDFNKGELTQAKTKELKNSLNEEFTLVHDLCMWVLDKAQASVSLIKSTLATMQGFLTWVPLGYIFQTQVVEVLLNLFPNPSYRNLALKCLTEVGGIQVGPDHHDTFIGMYERMVTYFPQGETIVSQYESASDEDQCFIQDLATFLSSFFRAHLEALEARPQHHASLLRGLDVLLHISFVEDQEVFKGCMDYWQHMLHVFAQGGGAGVAGGLVADAAPLHLAGAADQIHDVRKQLYDSLFSGMRMLMIERMAKPEEVLSVEDDSGNFVREVMKDADVVALYKVMREVLTYLTNLNIADTRNKMLMKLAKQRDRSEWSWGTLNRLCWAIGSISGTMLEEDESKFLVQVIRDLLDLCDSMRGKDNKAVIATNIMYVVGQYPRFLRAHWKFLKTVVNKLFEFMHEKHPGVQDMACETFLKICTRCKRKFVVVQQQGEPPFVEVLLQQLEDPRESPISDLENIQINLFYEAVGLMVAVATSPQQRDSYLAGLMALPNRTWDGYVALAQQQGPAPLTDPDVVRGIVKFLGVNNAVCASLGPAFEPQLRRNFEMMLHVYQAYSDLIAQAIQANPANAKSAAVKQYRAVKRQTLALVKTFASQCDPKGSAAFVTLHGHFVPAMEGPVLGDYAGSVPDARDSEVLSLYAVLIDRFDGQAEQIAPTVLRYVFESTLSMITADFSQYPEHRLKFFELLQSITMRCFNVLRTMTPQQQKLVMDSIVWAIRHTERNVAEKGLSLLLDMLRSFQISPDALQFHQAYYLELLREVLQVMTDTFHKPGFKLHTRILHHLFSIVQDQTLSGPIWPQDGGATYANNAEFVRDFVSGLLASAFPNMTQAQVQQVVYGMLTIRDLSQFKNHLRDFLVQTKTFADTDGLEPA
ncbi:unnamed protein product [Pedinophyceae sp. YPF-701]|nr:unnamed protein product [Pedinophyceae sp. YPF-701]